MNIKLISATLLIAGFNATSCYATPLEATTADRYIQTISIDNLLHNPDITPPNLTESALEANYMINGQSCWIHTVDYQEGYVVHSGPTQGCKSMITQVIITVKPVNKNTQPVYTSYILNIDTTKFATQAMIMRDFAATARDIPLQQSLIYAP